jgi:antibiotic biosynthesis monooxygenase (ABM) superfamily enzyme
MSVTLQGLGAEPIGDATEMVSILAPLEVREELLAWKDELALASARIEGSDGLEIYFPWAELQPRWVFMLRFKSVPQLQTWLDCEPRRSLMERARASWPGALQSQIVAGHGIAERPVALIVNTRVEPDKVADFKLWQAELMAAQSEFPGFLDGQLDEPRPGISEDWTIVLRFATSAHLKQWMESDARRDMIDKVSPALSAGQARAVVGSSFGAWFDLGGKGPPAWKASMVVLFGLYPIVMLQLRYYYPITDRLHIPLAPATFLGNVISVTLLSFVVMKLLNQVFQPWLMPAPERSGRTTLLGTLVMLIAYLSMVLLFSM